MTDFIRINTPRVEKIAAMIATIHKSAKSQKASEGDLFGLLGSVRNALGNKVVVVAEIADTDKAFIAAAGPGAAVHVMPADVPARVEIAMSNWSRDRIPLNVDDIPDNQLTAYATQIVARLCDAVEQIGDEA
jgi:hypothetical protein